ncbi:DUF4302 domain-containing protein [Chitinophagaceae bacterium LB-8]|uniref:DUF4302 domain-containing protein n=1 Tax=Paraflavisolibacter caeni TaxID=2982496 RepID=A0A9X2XN43_9BACT|nr:DUF4302 domain-containing protein [Paraflavisolibacter caeni]MCU7547634.1 DUF4302 domain-containing protein [Paraflavisolibacter caeni]
MSKYILFYILGLAVVFGSCTKETDNLFDQTSDERLSQTLSSFQQALAQAPGWKVYVYPHGLQSEEIDVGGFTYFMKFTDANRVSMVSDYDSVMSATPKESGYRLKAVQRPSIYFDTYSYLHIPADPTFEVSTSPTFQQGFGWGTDFDYSFVKTTPGDTIILKGNFNKSEAVMIKATQVEIDSAFNKGRLKTIRNFTSNYLDKNKYLYFVASSNLLSVPSFNLFLRKVVFYNFSASGNLSSIIETPFSYTLTGLHFKDTVTIGIYAFQDLLWDNVKQLYYFNSGGRRVEFANETSTIVSFSLAGMIGGTDYQVISIPPQPLPNQSATFTAKYNAVKANLKSGPYNLDLTYTQFVFDATNRTMNMNVYAYPGTNLLTAQYNYTYTVDNNGYFKFTRTGQNEYGRQVEGSMREILDYLETDNFRLTGTLTSTIILGQYTSKERPDFFFSGNLF